MMAGSMNTGSAFGSPFVPILHLNGENIHPTLDLGSYKFELELRATSTTVSEHLEIPTTLLTELTRSSEQLQFL